MQYFLMILLLASSVFSQLTPCADRACEDSIIDEIFSINGYSTPSQQIQKFWIWEVNPYPQNPNYPDEYWRISDLDIHGYSGLTTIPATISRLPYLKGIQFSHNSISTLPSEIGDMTLDRINLDSNQLTTLPSSFANLPTIRSSGGYFVMRVDHNKLCNVSTTLKTWLDQQVNPNWLATQDCSTENLEFTQISPLSVSYSPNPFRGSTRVEISDPTKDVSIRVFDIQGRLVKAIMGNNGLVKIDLTGFPNGAFWGRATVGNRVFTNKLLLVK